VAEGTSGVECVHGGIIRLRAKDRDAVSDAVSTSSSYAKRSSGTVAIWQSNEMSGRGSEMVKAANSARGTAEGQH
jgi:hypothetical protein